ncbi:MAG TPA: hypothetical protein VFJ01_13350 [Oleiagrimonas sp.]|nr:hypothetical protein [Oleiagrimonas sp.]
MPKPDAPQSSLGELSVPTTEDGRDVTDVAGRCWIKSANIIWYGDLSYRSIRVHHQKIGDWYIMGLHMGLCCGPIDALRRIKGGDELAWEGNITSSQPFAIHKPELYGGERKQGGIDGNGWVAMGEADQQPNAYLQSQLGLPTPAFRGLACVIFHGKVGALAPTIKKWAFQVERYSAGWRTPVWQPSLVKCGDGQNPAHLLYRVVTDPVTGMGQPDVVLDLDKMLAAAQTLHDEGFGLCLRWTRADVFSNFIQTVCDHIGAMWVDDAASGKKYLKLLRGDYVVDQLPLIDESNIVELTSYQSSSPQDTVNQLTVRWHNQDTDKDATVTAHNLANIQAQGTVVAQTRNYPGIWSQALATRALMRDLTSMSSMPAKLECKVLGSVDVTKGDVVAFSWGDLKIERMPMRVLKIDRGDDRSDVTTVTCAQDVFALPSISYVAVQDSKWKAPVTTPVALTYQRLCEMSYRDLRVLMTDYARRQLDPDSGLVYALGVAPANVVANDFELYTGTGSSLADVDTGDFCATGTLTATLADEPGPSTITLTNTDRLDQVVVGSAVRIDDEVCRVDAIDPLTGSVTLGRGCADTVPAMHAATARAWFSDTYRGSDLTEYHTGDTVSAKLLTRTAEGVLDEASAPATSISIMARHVRPYPPQKVRINGDYAPSTVTGAMTVAWARRNRGYIGKDLVDTNAADVAPQADVRESLAFYDANDNLLVSRDDIDDSSADVVLDYTGGVTMVLGTINDDGDSWQQQTRTFDYTPPGGTTASSITAATWTP